VKLTAVDHVWFWVTDMDAAVVFYGDSLGLPMRMRHGDDWAEFDGGGIRVGLHGAQHAGPSVPHGGTVVFEVDDLDLAKAGLEERGVTFDAHLGEVPGTARYASFEDPDGNSLQIIEYRAPAGDPEGAAH